MQGTGKWITGGFAAVIAFLGLLAASRAADEAFHYGGWIVAVLAVGSIFLMIRRHYDTLDAEHARERERLDAAAHHGHRR